MGKKINTLSENKTTVIDWENIHNCLEAFRTSLDMGWHVTEQEEEQILMARTRSLAGELNDEPLNQEFLEVAEFMLAGERYGIEMNVAGEVYALKDLTPLPCTPPFILGVVNVRGKVLTVIDIKELFELPDNGLNDLSKVIMIHACGMEAGILADAIVGVRSVPVSKIQPELPTITGIRAEYMKGVTGDQLIILNMENIFSDERMIVNEKV